MIEFASAVLLIVAMMATRKLWRAWVKSQELEVEIWLERSANDRQPKIHEVLVERDELVKKHGKWLTVADIKSA